MLQRQAGTEGTNTPHNKLLILYTDTTSKSNSPWPNLQEKKAPDYIFWQLQEANRGR